MSKFFFNNWKFSNKPINFFQEKVEQNIKEEKTQEKIVVESSKNHHTIDEKILIDLNDLEKDIQWISNLEQFQQIVNKYNQQIIKDGSNENTIGSGPTDGIMVIGEAPDYQNNQLESFVGDHKILLKKMLQYIDIDMESVYITTLSPWQPKNNRSFTAQEIKDLRPFILKLIEVVKPKKILLLGSVAVQGVLDTNKPLNIIRGQLYQVDHIPTVVSFNPGFLRRFPNFNTEAKKDMDLFKNIEV